MSSDQPTETAADFTARVRAAFPALSDTGDGTAYFDGPGGSQVPAVVARAVADAMTSGLSNRGTVTASERRAEAIVVEARSALGDLLGSDPRGVVLGRSMTQLTFDVARTLADDWGPGDEVIVTRLDHDANLRPWITWAERAGATVKRLGFDPVTAELDDITPLLTDRTRLVAVTAASNLFGTRPDVRAVADAAHASGALVYVDAVHLTPHAVVDRAALGADFVACSPYKFFGPHLGAVAADPALLELLRPNKLLPSSDLVPERFELGTLPYELLAGVGAAVDFIADLAPGAAMRPVATASSPRCPTSRCTRAPCSAPCCTDWRTSTASPSTATPPTAPPPRSSRSPGGPVVRSTRPSPPRASTLPRATSTPWRRRVTLVSATTGRCAPGWRRTRRRARWTAC